MKTGSSLPLTFHQDGFKDVLSFWLHTNPIIFYLFLSLVQLSHWELSSW